MFQEFVVKVNRYWSDESGSQGWDGWFYSKVYAIEGNKFLVYDDGSMSAYNTEEDYCEDGFVWVDFTEAIPRCGGKGYEMRVTPYTADTPQTDKDKVVCPNCGRSDYIRSFEKDFNIKNSEYRYKCINCNTYINDTPQTERSE